MIFFINNQTKSCHLLLSLWLMLGLTLCSTSVAQAQCQTQLSGTIAEFNFNDAPPACDNANVSIFGALRPYFRSDLYRYCPNISAGCGDVFLGSRGHANTTYFQNAICLFNFYNTPASVSQYGGGSDYDPSSTTFDPNSSVNLYMNYTVPQGGGGCMDNFSVVLRQKMYDGSTVNFEKMGMAVFRNGFLIHTETQNILASNVNGTPMNFGLDDSQFCADGSQEVVFKIVFGLVNQLVVGGANSPAATGVDDIKLTGNCLAPTSISGEIQRATCLAAGGSADNGKMTIFNFGINDHFDFTGGATYTGSATYATATPIPADGILSTTVPNPLGADTMYTVRVINAEGCSFDLTLNMRVKTCPIACDEPHSETISSTDATCTGLVSDDNGIISISGVVDGDKIGIFAGGPYAGSDYASADVLVGGAFTYTALPNPVSNQIYTIRIYNAINECYVDRTTEIFEFSCGPCSNATAEVMAANEDDLDSTPANSDQTEDDIFVIEACKSDLFVDLELSKTVSPTSGTTTDIYIYTLTLNNTGTMTATDIQVAENFLASVAPTVLTGTLGTTPDSLTITASSATIGTYGLASGWQLDSLQAGQSATLTIDVRAMIPGTYDNCAYVTNMFPDNDPDSVDSNDETANEDDDDCATITVTGMALPSIVKEFSPMLTVPNTPTRLTLKITNSGATAITLTSALTDIFPTSPGQMEIAATPNLLTNLSGITIAAGDVQVLIPSGTTLPPGLSQIQFDIIVPAEGHYCNDIAAGDLQTASGNNVLPSQACLAAYNAYVMPPITCIADICLGNPGDVDTLTLTIENRNATAMTLDQDFINALPVGVTLAGNSNTGTLTGVAAFSAGDTSFVFAAGSTIPPGVQTIIVPVTSTVAGCYSNIINMNAILVSVGGFSDVGNEDIAEPKMSCIAPVITGRDTSICVGDSLNLANLFTTTYGTLTYHSALPPTTGNELDTNLVAVNTDSMFYALVVDGACSDTLGMMVSVLIPDSLLVCEDGSDSITITADPGFTNYQWYNEAGILAGETNQALTLTNTSSGLSDGEERYYFRAIDGTGCPVALCCPIYVATENCCPIFANPSPSLTQTICEGETITSLEVTTTATNPDSIAFVYFSSPQTDSSVIYTGGIGIDTVQITMGNTTVQLSNVNVPTFVSNGAQADTFYVYGIMHPTPIAATCRPYQVNLVVVNPLPNLVTRDTNICTAQTVDLSTLVTDNFNLTGTTAYYTSLATAQAESGAIAGATVNPTTDTSFYVRKNTSLGCHSIAVIPVNVDSCDWGDLPDVTASTVMDDYQTTLANNGPVHVIIPGLMLGSSIDGELDGQASSNARGDGLDEDGLAIFPSLGLHPSLAFRLPFSYVNSTGNTAHVEAWIDWNGDGDFDEINEMVADWNDAGGAFSDRLETTVPLDAKIDAALGLRIRISHQDNMTPYGKQPNGEVEDYLLNLSCPTPICLPIKVTNLRN